MRLSHEMDEALIVASGDRTRGDWIRAVIATALKIPNEATGRKSAGAKRMLQAGREDMDTLRALAITTGKAIGMLKTTAQQFRLASHNDLHQKAELTLLDMQNAARELQAKLEALDVR